MRDFLQISALSISLMISLSACANSSIGEALETSLQADPQLQSNNTSLNPTPAVTPSPTPQTPTVQLPNTFPSIIPRYPNAELLAVTPSSEGSEAETTRWQTNDPINSVQSFYENQFQSNNWKIVSRPTDDGKDSFVAQKDNLKVDLSLEPSQTIGGKTTFILQYSSLSPTTQTTPEPTPSPSPVVSASPQTTPSPTVSPSPTNSETSEIPQDLQPFVTDVVQLGVLESASNSAANPSPNNSTLIQPNEPVTRGEFAQWLVETNNKIYANNPAKQVRLAVSSQKSVFSDVPKTHPNFAAIQGLAEAGLIPSSLSGENTSFQFRPNAPLTREELLAWKVPLDLRQVLPKATVDAVKERWGFQDAAKIDSKALPAVLADFNNGDEANIRRVYGFTTLFQPKKPVTRAEAAAALWYFGFQGDGLSAQEALKTPQQPVKPSSE